jgi:ABC-type branched-subunit amino acid transport system substrate-binding protein
VSGGGTSTRTRKLAGIRSLRSSEGLRLALAVILAAGVAVLIESLVNGGHHGHAAGSRSALGAGSSASESSARGGGARSRGAGGGGAAALGPAESPTGSSASPQQLYSEATHAAVASGPAVVHSLQHGWVNVVIDQPPAGVLSEQNSSIARGAGVAVAEVNSAGGLPRHVRIRLLPEDLDQLSATAATARLRSEGAAAVILPCDIDSQLSLAAELSRAGVLMLAPCNPEPAAGRRYPTYWPVGMPAPEEAAGLADYLHGLGVSTAFILGSTGTRYVELLTDDFRSAAQSAGVRVVGTTSVAMTGSSYPGVAHAIQASSPRPGVIFTAFPPPYVNRLAAGLRAEGVTEQMLGTTTMDTPLTLASDRAALENAAFASYGFPREDASARRFAAAYQRRFNRLPIGSFPGLGAETIRLIEDAARKGGSAAPGAIQDALARGITLHGVALASRTWERGGDHSPTGEVSISKVSSGSFLPLLATSTSELTSR